MRDFNINLLSFDTLQDINEFIDKLHHHHHFNNKYSNLLDTQKT